LLGWCLHYTWDFVLLSNTNDSSTLLHVCVCWCPRHDAMPWLKPAQHNRSEFLATSTVGHV
jgi:hypothetical protein